MSLTLLRFLYSYVQHPAYFRLGFPHSGLGILGRYLRNQSLWDRHLEQSKLTQELWVKEWNKSNRHSLSVLGAGRLLDFEISNYRDKCSSILLSDADSLCLPVWRRLIRSHPQVQFHTEITELSGILLKWKDQLLNEIQTTKTIESACEFLRQLPSLIPPTPEVITSLIRKHSSSAILSLNLLGQIPIVWQDFAFSLLEKKFKTQIKDAHQGIVDALVPSAQALILSHLEALNNSQAEEILIICDREYVFYPELKTEDEEPPLLWLPEHSPSELLDPGSWSHDPLEEGPQLSYLESMDALFDIPLTKKSFLALKFPGYIPTLLGNWLWNICPKSEEKNGMGTLHRVIALRLSQSKVMQ